MIIIRLTINSFLMQNPIYIVLGSQEAPITGLTSITSKQPKSFNLSEAVPSCVSANLTRKELKGINKQI